MEKNGFMVNFEGRIDSNVLIRRWSAYARMGAQSRKYYELCAYKCVL